MTENLGRPRRLGRRLLAALRNFTETFEIFGTQVVPNPEAGPIDHVVEDWPAGSYYPSYLRFGEHTEESGHREPSGDGDSPFSFFVHQQKMRTYLSRHDDCFGFTCVKLKKQSSKAGMIARRHYVHPRFFDAVSFTQEFVLDCRWNDNFSVQLTQQL